MRSLIFSLSLVIFIFPSHIFAQDISDPQASPDIRIQIFDGKEFICFTKLDAKYLLQLRLDFPPLLKQIGLLKTQVKNKDLQISELELGAKNLGKQLKIFEKQNADLREEIIDSQAWYKNTYLWFGVGFLIGVGATIGVAYAVK